MYNLASYNTYSLLALKRYCTSSVASSFGSSLPNRAWSDVSRGYRYGFNGKEKDSETASDAYDFGARIYDGRLGRWFAVDPAVKQLPSFGSYSYCMNNSITLIDPSGSFPYPIHIRSFIPEAQIVAGFKGDNRGFSTSLSATARVHQTLTVDPTEGTQKGLKTWCSPTRHTDLPSKTAKPTGKIEDFKSSKDKKKGKSIISFSTSYSASNPLIPEPISPDIDVTTTFKLTENLKKGTLDIVASQVGDKYPAAETFITDSKGTAIFIGVSPFEGNPGVSLPGDNKRPMMSSAFTVTIDKNGLFTGVKQGKLTYTIEEWNKRMRALPVEDKKPDFDGFGGGDSGGAGAGGVWYLKYFYKK